MEDYECVSTNSEFISECGTEKYNSFSSSASSVDSTARVARESITKWIEQNEECVWEGGHLNAYGVNESLDRTIQSTPIKDEFVKHSQTINLTNPNASITSYYKEISSTYPKKYKIHNGRITPFDKSFNANFSAACVFDTFDITNVFNDGTKHVSTSDCVEKREGNRSDYRKKEEIDASFETTDTSLIIDTLASIGDERSDKSPLIPIKRCALTESIKIPRKWGDSFESNVKSRPKSNLIQRTGNNIQLTPMTNRISIKDENDNERKLNKTLSNLRIPPKTNGQDRSERENKGNINVTVDNSSTEINLDRARGLNFRNEYNGTKLDFVDSEATFDQDHTKLLQKINFSKVSKNETSPNISPIKTMRYQYKTLHHRNDKNLSCMPQLNLQDYFITLPTSTKIIDTKIELTVCDLDKPIGISLMINGNLVIGERGNKNIVNVYNSVSGKLVKGLQSNRKYYRPSDMTTLSDGRMVVRDDKGLHMFDESGKFIRLVIPKGVYGRCYGVASDGRGNIITINTNPLGIQDCITKKGETDVLVIDFENDVILEKIELTDIITNKVTSACRFLQCDGKKIYVVDLGLDLVYVLELGTPNVKSFGKSGKMSGEWKDPAGIAIDSAGNMIIADACNNRIQVFDKHRNYLGLLKISIPLNRPSGICLDIERKSLYILNLKGSNSLIKVGFISHSENASINKSIRSQRFKTYISKFL